MAGTAGTNGVGDVADPDENMELLWTDLARVVAHAGDRLTRIKLGFVR